MCLVCYTYVFKTCGVRADANADVRGIPNGPWWCPCWFPFTLAEYESYTFDKGTWRNEVLFFWSPTQCTDTQCTEDTCCDWVMCSGPSIAFFSIETVIITISMLCGLFTDRCKCVCSVSYNSCKDLCCSCKNNSRIQCVNLCTNLCNKCENLCKQCATLCAQCANLCKTFANSNGDSVPSGANNVTTVIGGNSELPPPYVPNPAPPPPYDVIATQPAPQS